MIKKIIIAIFVEDTYRHERTKQNKTFRTHSGKYLIKEYNTKANELRQLSRSNEDQYIESIPEYMILEDKNLNDRAIGKIIQIIDAKI